MKNEATSAPTRWQRNKTIAAWLALVSGVWGLHRFYLRGVFDWIGWLHPIPTALGLYGIQRVQDFGLDDRLSWVLVPLLGFNFAITALIAIYWGLMSQEKWNAREGFEEAAPNGQTHWPTIFAVVLALLLGTTALMGSLVYSFQRYFEVQVEEARKISQ